MSHSLRQSVRNQGQPDMMHVTPASVFHVLCS